MREKDRDGRSAHFQRLVVLISLCLAGCDNTASNRSNEQANEAAITGPTRSITVLQPIADIKYPAQFVEGHCSVKDATGKTIFHDYVIDPDGTRGWLEAIVMMDGEQRTLSASREDATIFSDGEIKVTIQQVGPSRYVGEDAAKFRGTLTLSNANGTHRIPINGDCYADGFDTINEMNDLKFQQIEEAGPLPTSQPQGGRDRSSDVSRLMDSWLKNTNACRGGGVSEEEMFEGCDGVVEDSARLKELGYCHGRKGEANYEMEWHRCGPDSL